MDIKRAFVDDVADKPALEALLVDYFEIILKMFAEAGGPQLSATDMAAESVEHLSDYLPPDGRTLLAHGPDGQLLGCGVIRKIRPDAVELKRMFVRPEAQGTGLGRKLFEMRMDEVPRMGCNEVYVDTVKGNTAMLNMYEKRGFTYIPRYPENANPPEYSSNLVYLKYRFPGATAS